MAGRTLVAAGWATIEVWAHQLLRLLAFVLLARLLGPAVYGTVYLALVPSITAQTLTTEGGWAEALIQDAGLEDEDTASIFWFLLFLGLGLVGPVAACGPLMAALLGEPALAWLCPVLALAVPFQALCVVPVALFQRRLDMAPLALRGVVAIAAAAVIGLGLALAGAGVWSLVGFELVQPVAASAVLWARLDWRPPRRCSRSRVARLARTALPLMGERLLLLAEGVLLPRLLLGAALGPTALGQFGAARRMFDLAGELVQRPLVRVVLPSFAAAQADRERLTAILVRGAEIVALLVLPAYAGLAVLAPDLVALAFGAAWLPAGAVLAALAPLGPVAAWSQLAGSLLVATGHARQQVRLAGVGSLVLAMLTVPAALLGPVAIAAAFTARGLLMLPLRLAAVAACTRVRPGPAVRRSLPALAAAGALALVLAAVRPALAVDGVTPLELATLLALGAAAFPATLFLLDRHLAWRLAELARNVCRSR